MNTLSDYHIKQKKYIPIFPRATGKPTIYIEGYPYEDDEPMSATGFHADQITTLSDQLSRYFAVDELIYIGVDNFIYYREGNMSKVVAPDIYVVFGVKKYPQRRSFYTWAEGAVPAVVFEFLSDSTADKDRHEKVQIYLKDMGAQEYFIHQPEMDKPSEFRGWQRSPSGNIVEIEPDAEGGLFSHALNLWLRWQEDQTTYVRLLRPYLPDETPITTSMEEKSLREEEQQLREEEQHRREMAEARVSELEVEIERLRAQMARTESDND